MAIRSSLVFLLFKNLKLSCCKKKEKNMDAPAIALILGLSSLITAYLYDRHARKFNQEEEDLLEPPDYSFYEKLQGQRISVTVQKEASVIGYGFETTLLGLLYGIFDTVQNIPKERFPFCFTGQDDELKKINPEIFPILIVSHSTQKDVATGNYFFHANCILISDNVERKIHRASIQTEQGEGVYDLSRKVLKWVYHTHFERTNQ